MATAEFHPGNGQLPAGARRAGYDVDHTVLYVARAPHKGGLHIGKYRADWTAAPISWGGEEVWRPDYEVWVGRLSDGSEGVWEPRSDASDAVVCGHEADGTALYAARAWHAGGWQIGKWRRDWIAAAIAHCGTEVWIDDSRCFVPAATSTGIRLSLGGNEPW